MAKTQEISVLTIGLGDSSLDLLSPMLNHDNVTFSIICSNILDYDLPPQVENGARVWYRDELRSTLNVLAPEIYSIPESLKNLLIENDRLQLSDHDLAITTILTRLNRIQVISNSHINYCLRKQKEQMYLYFH